ncbi:TonB-dependent receptor plug domain-containing protein, partial [Sphingomonas oligophenolica]
MSKSFHRYAILASTILACGAWGSAFAQDRPAPENTAPDDVIVSARRVDERLQDVPISITVFNQQQLTSRNVVNAQDLATYTPSLSANANFGNENTTFALRGFAQDIGTAPSVGVYFADVVAPRGASNGLPAGDGVLPGSFFDLQNVQVLKGPQGTLFGRNTTGGAVLLVPQRPTYKLEGYVEGSYGNYDMRRVQGVLNIPLSDTFRVRMGVDRMTRDGYLNNISGVGPKD